MRRGGKLWDLKTASAVLEDDVLAPLWVPAVAIEGEVVVVSPRCRRPAQQPHPGLLGGPPGLLLIAGDACARHVLPYVLTSPVSGNNVVYGERPALPAAVLAGERVPNEDLAPAELLLKAWTLDHVYEAYYRWYVERQRGAVDRGRVILQHFRLPLPEHDDRPPRPADVERFVVLVENQHRLVDHGEKLPE